ncbi:MAG: FliH/SctL family protein [Polyangiales bacterium]
MAERREAVEVAFALAARVLSACGAHERVVAVEGLRAALDRLDPADVCLARVHPTDLAPCEAEVAGARAQVRVVADETLSPGDVVLEGRLGFLDARLAARLAALRASLELGR